MLFLSGVLVSYNEEKTAEFGRAIIFYFETGITELPTVPEGPGQSRYSSLPECPARYYNLSIQCPGQEAKRQTAT